MAAPDSINHWYDDDGKAWAVPSNCPKCRVVLVKPVDRQAIVNVPRPGRGYLDWYRRWMERVAAWTWR